MQDTLIGNAEAKGTAREEASASFAAPEGAQPDAPLAPARGESDRAWEAFRVYLELGPQRRYAAVARKVGASLRTIRRWASQFDWRGRIQASTARHIAAYEDVQSVLQREETVDAAARARALRERQYAVAEAMLDAAERYLEGMEEGDLDQMSFGDACKALAVASRLGQPTVGEHANESAAPLRNLRDQLTVLLDQACREAPAQFQRSTFHHSRAMKDERNQRWNCSRCEQSRRAERRASEQGNERSIELPAGPRADRSQREHSHLWQCFRGDDHYSQKKARRARKTGAKCGHQRPIGANQGQFAPWPPLTDY